jgi:uncharacterized Ntn-hydrolase superfamily protein
MTFSIAGRCERTNRFGVAISSSSPAVAARCAFARAGVGAACSQNITDPRLGDRLLDLLAGGASAPDALAQVVAESTNIAFRQLSVVDRAGATASYSGDFTLGTHATVNSHNVVAAGNLLADAEIPNLMVAAFDRSPDADLEERLLAGLHAGLAAGGEEGPVHSAGLLVVDQVEWPVTDLRVDWSDDPIGDLSKLWRLWRPLLSDYVVRALDPTSAPAYCVPGDPHRP